jgi:two-component system response regulator
MPKLDGLQVLRLLRRARTSDQDVPPPVVVLTSSDDADDITQAYSQGANSYIRKPIDYADFQQTVQQLAEYWLKVNEPPPAPHR